MIRTVLVIGVVTHAMGKRSVWSRLTALTDLYLYRLGPQRISLLVLANGRSRTMPSGWYVLVYASFHLFVYLLFLLVFLYNFISRILHFLSLGCTMIWYAGGSRTALVYSFDLLRENLTLASSLRWAGMCLWNRPTRLHLCEYLSNVFQWDASDFKSLRSRLDDISSLL